MTEPPTAGLEKSQPSPSARIGWGLLIIATLYVCYFSHLGAIGFVGPDEPRYAWIARAMAETGDWVTPRLYGQPWFEKPPLYYWGAAISFKVSGVSEAAARLPSAISALLATLALAWLAWRMYGAETARWLLLLLPTTVGMIGFSHAAATDMPFSGMLTIAMVYAAVVLRLIPAAEGGAIPAPTSLSTPWSALVLFGLFLGLAVLAKGPAGIILCGGAVFFWGIFTKRWRDAFRLLHPAAVAAFCLTALPWYILCARRNHDFFRVFIIEHNFKRYLTPEFQHIQPFWFYGPVFLLAILPWSILFLWTAVPSIAPAARSRTLSADILFFGSWIIFCVAFFSASQSKLPGYILPAIPPVGLILSRGYLALAGKRRTLFGAVSLTIGLGIFVVAELAGAARIHAVRDSAPVLFAVLRVLLILAMPNILLGLTFLVSKHRLFQNACLIVAVIGLVGPLFPADGILNDLEPIYFGQKDFALQLITHRVPLERTFFYLGVSRSTRYALNFYLHREIPDWNQSARLDAYVIDGSMDCRRLRKKGFECEQVPLGGAEERWSVSHVTPRTSVGPARSRQPQ
ncbi:MAG: glycosyltransferase family 39 protein [Candidatus Acidiferrum sp.]